ncbi:MAG: hypothetical protein HY914_07485 [Desulfomonile tiedjei]|nr:hypothetical protein [Desulfomonile tiedjei]
MRSFDLAGLARSQGGEYVLGKKDLHSDACYMVYGRLDPDGSARPVKPGIGYEEILCAIDGPLIMHTDRGETVLERGHAVHVREDESFAIANRSDRPVVYVLAGAAAARDETVTVHGNKRIPLK